MVFAGNGVPPTESTGIKRGLTHDEVTHDLLEEILKELKKMNLQLYILTDTHIKDTEVNSA